MKIGYLVPEFPGQTHAFFWREIRELQRLGVEVDLLSTRRPRSGKARHDWAGEATGRTTFLSDTAKRSVFARSTWALAQRLRSEGQTRISAFVTAASAVGLARRSRAAGFGHVHVHSCARAADVARAAAMVSGLTYSLTLHSPIHQFGGDQERKWADASFGIAVTEVLRTSALRAVGSARTPVAVAPMGVDLNTFTRGGSYAPWVGAGPFRIVTCGRLNPCKGHDDSIRAVGLLRQEGVPAELTIVGGTDGRHERYPEELRRLATELGIEDAVRLAGSVGEREVAKELAAAHAFVLSSRNEAIGVATMEAMAMGLPVVVTGCPGVEELVDSAAVGRLVPVDSPSETAAAVSRFAGDPSLAVAVGKAARRRVEERFHSGVSAALIARMLGMSVVESKTDDDRLVRVEDFTAVDRRPTPESPVQHLTSV